MPRTAGGVCDIGAYELVRCEGRIADRIGTNGNDRLLGTAGADAFLLLGGDDKAFGFARQRRLLRGGRQRPAFGGSGKRPDRSATPARTG